MISFNVVVGLDFLPSCHLTRNLTLLCPAWKGFCSGNTAMITLGRCSFGDKHKPMCDCSIEQQAQLWFVCGCILNS